MTITICSSIYICWLIFFFFNDTATTEIYTLSLHDALPIYLPDHFTRQFSPMLALAVAAQVTTTLRFATTMLDNDFRHPEVIDRKSTRLNSSHANISYAVFCLKKKDNHVRHVVQHLIHRRVH